MKIEVVIYYTWMGQERFIDGMKSLEVRDIPQKNSFQMNVHHSHPDGLLKQFPGPLPEVLIQ